MSRHSHDPNAALALAELERAVLEGESDTAIATALRVSQELNVPMTAAAVAGGLTRTRAYAVLERTTDQIGPIYGRSLRRLVAAAMGNAVPLGLNATATRWSVDPEDMARALSRLASRGAAELLVRTGDGTRLVDEFWVPGPDHAAWVNSELEALRWVSSERFAVYVELPPGTRRAIAGAANDLLPDLAGVIEAGRASLVTWDELAAAVKADDSREAIDAARALWDEICVHAELGQQPFIVRELIPPARAIA